MHSVLAWLSTRFVTFCCLRELCALSSTKDIMLRCVTERIVLYAVRLSLHSSTLIVGCVRLLQRAQAKDFKYYIRLDSAPFPTASWQFVQKLKEAMSAC
jgi:hypothetical protein